MNHGKYHLPDIYNMNVTHNLQKEKRSQHFGIPNTFQVSEKTEMERKELHAKHESRNLTIVNMVIIAKYRSNLNSLKCAYLYSHNFKQPIHVYPSID
jgi:type IV secretory pathway TraG/TraD family ATPase VirD4